MNPGNNGFAFALRSEYIDKTGLIAAINNTINTANSLTCVSRPRRFGKSYAAQMLCAYYGKGVDSHPLFEKLKIAQSDTYERHINAYNVIYIDMAAIKPSCDGFKSIVPFIKECITREIAEAQPDVRVSDDLPTTMLNAVNAMGGRFIMIIDEWDAPIREYPQGALVYLELLRQLFKNSAITPRLFAAVYMTGILPIKKVKGQSAVSDFKEYTMLRPGPFAPYVGFTEREVRELCGKYNCGFSEMKRWYDGYELKNVGAVYNPNSVMSAIEYHEYASYWSQSSAANNLMDFIRWDVDGLRQAIIELMGGVEIEIDTGGYDNDLSYQNRDAALTMFTHLGYLSYNQDKHAVKIPNEEIRLEFARTLKQTDNAETLKRVRESSRLIVDTIHGNAEAVALAIKTAHIESSNPLNRNSESSLRAAIQVAYFAYKDYYVKLEELPSGRGYADIVYLPKKGLEIPILLIELKWNSDADTVIRQIREKRYINAIEGFGGDVLLVGVSYDRRTGGYGCRIEEWTCRDNGEWGMGNDSYPSYRRSYPVK